MVFYANLYSMMRQLKWSCDVVVSEMGCRSEVSGSNPAVTATGRGPILTNFTSSSVLLFRLYALNIASHFRDKEQLTGKSEHKSVGRIELQNTKREQQLPEVLSLREGRF